jgi:hypothetical protein
MSSTLSQLLSLRTQLDTMIAAASGGAEVVVKDSKKKAVKADKKPRANAGQGTAWSSFSSKIQADHKEELDAVKADAAARRAAAKEAGEDAPEDTKGAHLHWCSRYKLEHEAEWLAFKASWELEHPKSSATSVADSESVTEADAPAPVKGKRGAKKDSDRTPEELAVVKAKRAAAKAAKAAAKSVDEEVSRASSVLPAAVEPVAEEEEVENNLLAFRYKKVNYLRFGHKDSEGDDVWHEDGDLWLASADGSKGAYAGQLTADGSINTSAEVMANPPEIE